MRETCRVPSRSTSAAGAVHVRVRAMAWRISADSGHAGGRCLGPPVGGLVRREADGDDDRATPRLAIGTRRHGGNGGDAPARAIHRSWGLLGFEGAESLASPAVIPRVGWLSGESGVRQARPPQPRTLRLNAPHRPLRRAHAPRGSRLGPSLASRLRREAKAGHVPHRERERRAKQVGDHRSSTVTRARRAGAKRGIVNSDRGRRDTVPRQGAGIRVELLVQRLHARNGEAPFSSKSTCRKSPMRP